MTSQAPKELMTISIQFRNHIFSGFERVDGSIEFLMHGIDPLQAIDVLAFEPHRDYTIKLLGYKKTKYYKFTDEDLENIINDIKKVIDKKLGIFEVETEE